MDSQTDITSILVVDDMPENLSLLTDILTEAGYGVRQAKNGEQALKAVLALPPDMILLDIKMPDMNGFEVCKKLKAEQRTANTPVIFISALSDIHDRVTGFEVGGVDFITKPVQREEVLARVKTHLELHRLQKNLELEVRERTAELAKRTEAEQKLTENNEKLERYVIELDASRNDMERQASEMAALAEEEANLSERLRYEVEVKNRFFSIISHDLKGPFTSLLGMTKMMSQMSEHFTKDKLVSYAANVNDAGERIFTLLHNLLEWSRLQMEGAKLEPVTLALDEMIQECVDLLKPIALDKDITLNNTVYKQAAYADQDMVRTIIRNLIANALKFTPSGGKIEVFLCEEGDEVQVTVADSGVGISADVIDGIFAIDQKTSTIGTAGEKGTGLGLPLCKDMLERNGGRIWVESTEGEGSKFHFTLPIG